MEQSRTFHNSRGELSTLLLENVSQLIQMKITSIESSRKTHTRSFTVRPKPEIIAQSFGVPRADLERALQLFLASQDERLLVGIIQQPLVNFQKSTTFIPMMVRYFFCESAENMVHGNKRWSIPERSSSVRHPPNRHVSFDYSPEQSGSNEAHTESIAQQDREMRNEEARSLRMARIRSNVEHERERSQRTREARHPQHRHAESSANRQPGREAHRFQPSSDSRVDSWMRHPEYPSPRSSESNDSSLSTTMPGTFPSEPRRTTERGIPSNAATAFNSSGRTRHVPPQQSPSEEEMLIGGDRMHARHRHRFCEPLDYPDEAWEEPSGTPRNVGPAQNTNARSGWRFWN